MSPEQDLIFPEIEARVEERLALPLADRLVWLAAGGDLGAAVTVLVFALNALALALLGPGAYSLDARRFGRRLVVLPRA